MSVEYVVKGYITEFCDKFGVKLEHLKGKSRVLEINNTRKLLFYMLRRVFKLKHREIGEIWHLIILKSIFIIKKRRQKKTS